MLIYALLNLAINIYMGIVILQVIIHWLVAFGVLNTGNAQARNLIELLAKATDPVLKRLQKYVPPIAGIDITPIILIIGLEMLQAIIHSLFYRPFLGL